MPPPPLPTPFSPSPQEEPHLLAAIGNPNHSLREIADACGCTTEALALWMSQPEIVARLSATDSITTWRTRLVAQAQLTKVVATCSHILDHFNADPTYPLNVPAPSPSPHAASRWQGLAHPAFPLYLRRAESARRAAALLTRLSKLPETTRTQRATDAAAPSRVGAVHPTPNEHNDHTTTPNSTPRATTSTLPAPSPAANPTPPEPEAQPATPPPDPSESPNLSEQLADLLSPSGPNPAPNPNPNLLVSSPDAPHEHWP